MPLRFLRAWSRHNRRFFFTYFTCCSHEISEVITCVFNKNVFVTCCYICSISHSCKNLAGISCCKVRFASDQQQWLGKFVTSPLLCSTHIIAKLSTNTHKNCDIEYTTWFCDLFFFCTKHKHKQQLSSEDKNVFLFSRIIGCNQIQWNYILWPNSRHPLVQMLQPFLRPVWILYLRFYAIKA